mgnify:CR=1 FL=1
MESSIFIFSEQTRGRISVRSLSFPPAGSTPYEKFSQLREDYLYRVPFDSAFASLGDFRDICALLKGKVLSDVMAKIADGSVMTYLSFCTAIIFSGLE